MPSKGKENAPRTDLPPEKDPYYRGYFGTEEEEGVVREREVEEADERKAGEGAGGGSGARRRRRGPAA